MEMHKTKMLECKFLLLRYVPDAVKNEFVNIGLVLLPPQGQPELRFDKDWSRVRTLYPQADTELLDAFRNELSDQATRELVLPNVRDSFSNVLQAAEFKACLASSPAEEADKLAKIYLEAPPERRLRETSARQTILQIFDREFAREGVQALKRSIAASEYTRSGDPLEIDRGYGFDSTLKMFHATPLKHGVNAAKVLAFSYPEMAAGIEEKKHIHTHLTAIVEDGLEKTDEVGFAWETLEHRGIQIATVSEIPDLAKTAARDLRML